MDFWRNEWDRVADTTAATSLERLFDMDRIMGDPPLVLASEKNKNNISKISWGETSGIYPTKDVTNPSNSELYSPEKWDSTKTAELLKARAAIHLIGTTRNTHVKKLECKMKNIEKTLATYHLIDNFPEVDSVIKNDADVRFFYLTSKATKNTPATNPNYYNQKCVKSYGPFYNIGKGDVPKGPIYIHFYKAIAL